MPIAHTMSPRPRDAESTLPFNIFTTVGALEIGIMVALILSGMVGAQVISYFRRGRDDPKVVRYLVGICGSLEICHSIAICHTLYTVTVIQYGQPELLLVPPLSLDLTMVMSGFMGPLEQGWFAYRLYRLTKTLTLPVFCMCLTIMRFIGLMGLSFIALHQYPLPEYTQRASWLMECILIISAVLDTTLVGALCYFLSSWRLDKSRVMHKIITQIMTWTIESGAVTVVGALGLLVTFLTMKNNMVYIGFFVVQPKLFSNSLMLSLNSRNRFSDLIRASTVEVSRPPPSMIAQLEMTSYPSSSTSYNTTGILGIKVQAFEGYQGGMAI